MFEAIGFTVVVAVSSILAICVCGWLLFVMADLVRYTYRKMKAGYNWLSGKARLEALQADVDSLRKANDSLRKSMDAMAAEATALAEDTLKLCAKNAEDLKLMATDSNVRALLAEQEKALLARIDVIPTVAAPAMDELTAAHAETKRALQDDIIILSTRLRELEHRLSGEHHSQPEQSTHGRSRKRNNARHEETEGLLHESLHSPAETQTVVSKPEVVHVPVPEELMGTPVKRRPLTA